MRHASFGDVDFYQQKKEIQERFRAIVPKLQALDQNQYYKQAIQRFRDVLVPVIPVDMGRLPLYSEDGKTLARNKSSCVLALISVFVQKFWTFCENPGLELDFALADAHLETLEDMARFGLNGFKIVGKKYPGYYLEDA